MGYDIGISKTVNGYTFDICSSALTKCLRRGCEFEALFWALELADSGYDPYVFKRLSISAVEDVGLADPMAIVIVNACRETWMSYRRKEEGKTVLPETNILAMAIMYLCRANKNRMADDLAYLMDCKRKGKDPKDGGKVEPLKLPIMQEYVDGHTNEGKRKLYKLAKEKGDSFLHQWNCEFYHDVARSNKIREIKGGQENWMEVMAKEAGCDYEIYKQPIFKLTPYKGGEVKQDIKMEKVEDGVYKVESFTSPGTFYQVDTVDRTCTCEFFKEKQTPCKHINAVVKPEKKKTERQEGLFKNDSEM